MQTIKEILSTRLRDAFAAAFPEADFAALPLDAPVEVEVAFTFA